VFGGGKLSFEKKSFNAKRELRAASASS